MHPGDKAAVQLSWESAKGSQAQFSPHWQLGPQAQDWAGAAATLLEAGAQLQTGVQVQGLQVQVLVLVMAVSKVRFR